MAQQFDGNGSVISDVRLPDGRIFQARTMDQVLGVSAQVFGLDHAMTIYTRLTGCTLGIHTGKYYIGEEMRAQVDAWLDDPALVSEAVDGG